MGLKYFTLLCVSAFIPSVSAYCLSRAFLRFKRLHNASGMSLAGGASIGIVICLSAALLALLFPDSYHFYKALIPPALLILFAGFWDDIYELTVAGKLIIQLAATALLVVLGLRTRIFFLSDSANILVTFVWVLVITNAFNLLDIMDGLCAVVAIIVALGLSLVCLFTRDMPLSFFLGVFIGAIAGFLPLNLPHARLYLGNSGSHFIGFILAAVSIHMSYASIYNQTALISPVFIMGFPVFDTIFVSFMRLAQGRSAIEKSKDHLALRFLKLGHSKQNALFIMSGGASLFVLCGVVLSRLSGRVGVLMILIVLSASLVLAKAISMVAVDE